MTAGRGILHIETPPEELVVSGGLFHGVQLWVNLPAKKKWIPPAYQPLEAGDVALVASPDAGALVRVIAGEVAGVVGPGSTHTPISLMHASITPGSVVELPWNPCLQLAGLRPRRIGRGRPGSSARSHRSAGGVRPGRVADRCGPVPVRTRDRRTWRCCSSEASRLASTSNTTGPS